MSKVLLFPGFAGSELRYPSILSYLSSAVWLNIRSLALGGWELMRLNDAASGSWIPGAPDLVGGGAIPYAYPILKQSLRQAGLDVIDVPIDWRRPLAANLPAVLTLIRSLSSGEPVRIVAHSRGGILAAMAWTSLTLSGEGSRVQRAVSLGTPWLGSYEPIGYLGGWAQTIETVQQILSATALLLTPLLYLRALRLVCASWPGLYELLPAPALGAAVRDTRIEEVYSPARWQAAGVPVSALHLGSALSRWTSPTMPPQTDSWLLIAGTGNATRGPLTPSLDFASAGCVPPALDGDGIVPTASAFASPNRAVAVQVPHADLPSRSESLGPAVAFLAGA